MEMTCVKDWRHYDMNERKWLLPTIKKGETVEVQKWLGVHTFILTKGDKHYIKDSELNEYFQ